MKEATKTVYITDDGEEFISIEKAQEHERAEAKKKHALERLKVYSVQHGFDSTEGRGYFAKTLIISDASSGVLTQWCLDTFGEPLAEWHQGSFFESWLLYDTDKDASWAVKQKGSVPYYAHRPTDVRLVSKADFTWAGLPKSEYPWPRPEVKR